MSSKAYSEIYRPKKPKQLIGDDQRSIAKALLKKVEQGDIVQELLFSGSSGVGKTTIARMYIQKILGDLNIDDCWDEVNCSAETGIDHMRRIIDQTAYMPMFPFKYQVYYLDEIHGLSKAAQNSLLKLLEPCPAHVIIVASTTESNKLINTLRSRFTEYKLSIPTDKDFCTLWDWILAKNKTIESKSQIRDEIIAISAGNIRTFDRLIQQYVEGSYTGYQELAKDEQSLIYQVLFRKPNVPEWFKAAEQEKSYVGLLVGMCNYSIKIIQGKSKPQVKDRASLILKHFGNGLSREIPERVGFFSKLNNLYQDEDFK